MSVLLQRELSALRQRLFSVLYPYRQIFSDCEACMSKLSIVLLVVLTFVAAVVGAFLPMFVMSRGVGMMVPAAGGTAVISADAPADGMMRMFAPNGMGGGFAGTGQRHLDVTASAAVSAAPDTATVQLGVTTQASSAGAALTQNSTDTAAVIAAVVKLGVAEKDIQTSNFNVYPTYDTTGTRITGYQVTNTVTVTIRDIKTTGSLLDQVVQAGANNISGLSFSIADTSSLVADARTKAYAAAKAKAEAMAAAAGVELGEVISVTESSQPATVYPVAKVAMDAMAAAPIQAGSQDVTVDVSIVYALR